MILHEKPFEDLSSRELYEILRLRSEVFIVEQGGRYQDLDRIDYESIHLFLTDSCGEIAGCLRIFPKPGQPGTVQLGRLVSRDRRQGLGRLLMEAAEQAAVSAYGAKQLFLDGRRDARGFYEKCGYTAHLPASFTEENTPYYEFTKACKTGG